VAESETNMAAAAARCGLTVPHGEETTGSRPVSEVEECSAKRSCTDTTLFAVVIARLLLVTILALFSGVSVAARGLMPLEVGPIQWTHSVCSRTPWEVTTAGSRAVNTEAMAAKADKWRARAVTAAVHIQRHARGFAARFYFGRLLGRVLLEQRAANVIVQAAMRWQRQRRGWAASEAEVRAATAIQAAARRQGWPQALMAASIRKQLYFQGRRQELQAFQALEYIPDEHYHRWRAAYITASRLYDKTPHGRVLFTKRVRRRVPERFAISIEAADAAATVLQRSWRASAAVRAAYARALEELWAEPLPLPAQLMRNWWAKLHGEKVAEMLARLAAIADKNTHDCWARLVDGHAAVLQRAWRASVAAATWRARSHAAVRVQRAWRTARGLGPEKPRRHKPQSAKHARAQKARARAPRGGRA
jgi:hypothetical protein